MKTIHSVVTLGLLIASIGFSQTVKTDMDRSVSWDRYRTFSWQDAKKTNGVVDNSLVSNRVRRAFSDQLMKQGWTMNNDQPDVYLSYHIAAHNQREIIQTGGFGPWGGGFRRGFYGGGFYGGNVFTVNYIAGSLIVDMVDAHTGDLIWRGYASDRASHMPDLVSDKKIDKIAEKALKNLPRHSS
ncbi:DUF4136 domain-containing protein [Bryobacter aggregatus]|uniref:DUF4136 domain-containing protein n=1 Tax=Bryobacter aggregatus TaxID=360054 RepID=UPI0006903C82|nr:DUF4136 domain-containing protein [Bryobacter aggregatus]